MSAQPIYTPVQGSPFQPGDIAQVVECTDECGYPELIGKTGTVEYLEYNCGCSQSYPSDPMIGVRFDDGTTQEFWKEELKRQP